MLGILLIVTKSILQNIHRCTQKQKRWHDFQVVIALKEPIDILKNTQIYCHFAPVGVDFSNSKGYSVPSTNKVKLFASSERDLNSIQAFSNIWHDCECCPFYSFLGEHSVGITSAQQDIEDVRFLIFGNMFTGCNERPNYLARIQSIALIPRSSNSDSDTYFN